MKPQNSKKPKNYEFQVVCYIFAILFLALIVYFIYFQAVRSERFINNPYNPLQTLFSKHVVRGELRSADGEVLAKTVTDADGNETREYPHGQMFAHVIGYSGNTSTGLENQANFYLLRSHSMIFEQIANDVSGEKNPGDHVVTTLNYGLQKAAYDALGKKDGAVIVMEARTGKILAMVSKPDYDPNSVFENWEAINASDSSVLLNRATQGKYTPGSVFKMVTTLEFFREAPEACGMYRYDCDGEFTSGGKTIHCAGNTSHKEQDLKQSFANSCNSSYASLCLMLNKKQLSKTCSTLLFDTDLPIAFESTQSRFSLPENASEALTMETSIGQGATTVSPLHMMLLAGAVCNDGVLMTPRLIDHVENDRGGIVDKTTPKAYRTLFTKEESTFLQECMRETVLSGTATKLNNKAYEAYGKTGTAQISDSSDKTNAWFVGYVKKEGKEDLAIAVIVENGSGTKHAVPVAKAVFDAY